MTKSHALAFLLTLTLAVAAASSARASDDDVKALSKDQLAQLDKGAASIDVSSYPAGLQKNYAVFRQKCALCHTLARPINCGFALPDEWSRYIKRMMHKPGSNISPVQAKKIYEFLVYDASVRKKALLDGKIAGADAAEKADAAARLKAILTAYGVQ